jgi:uncharacterized protein (UPF0248 family)
MSKRSFPRDILNRLKWEEGLSLQDAEIVILHRGAPNDRLRIKGKDVISIGHMFFDTPDASIPFHRVEEIWHRRMKLFDRKDYRKTRR